MACVNKPFSPVWNIVGFAQQSFGDELVRFDFPTDSVFTQDMFAEINLIFKVKSYTDSKICMT